MSELLDRLKLALADRYSVERELGRGGMATVYLAYDLKHHRKIALKVMLPEIAASIGSARFAREIEVAARLQHPNILPLLDSGEVDELFYYAMPYVEGESLRDRLTTVGALPIPEVVRIMTEVADALGHAHEHGVVHRDIKPENVLISGRHALVADFGVAKATTTATGPQRLTRTGMAIGTPAYMAPEQAMADAHLDHRVDIYALGVMGFEMLTGHAPFSAGSVQEMLAAQVNTTPQTVGHYRPNVPPALAAIVMKCLEKTPADRWQTADEIVARLEPLAGPSGEVLTAPTVPLVIAPSRRRLVLAAVVPGIFGVVGIAAAVMMLTGRVRRPVTGITASGIAQVTSDPGVEFQPAISADGEQVAYTASARGSTRILVRSAVNVGAGGEIALGDTLYGMPWRASWSPDGEYVHYLACPRNGPVHLGAANAFGFSGCRPVATSRLGGASRLVTRLTAPEWTVSPDGSRLAWFAGDSIITMLSSGAERRVLAVHPGTGRTEVHSLTWSPDGRRLAYVDGNVSWLTSANVDVSAVWVVDLQAGKPHQVTDGEHLNVSPAWLDTDHLLFVSDRDGPRAVYVVPVGDDGPGGDPRPVPGLADPHSISYAPAAGRLAFTKFTSRQNIWSWPLGASAPLSIRDGTPVTAGNYLLEEHDISPDGRSIVYASAVRGNLDLYRMPVAGGESVALTSTPVDEDGPVWSPDGGEIAYYTMEPGNTSQVWVMPAEGGPPVRLSTGLAMSYLPRWRRDGLAVSFSSLTGAEIRVWVATRDSAGAPWHAPAQLVDARVNAQDWAPDGKRFVSSMVTPVLMDVGTGDRATEAAWPAAHAVRLDRNSPLRWARDGRTIYGVGTHQDGRRGVWAVPLTGTDARLVMAFDDPSIIPLTGTAGLLSVGPDRLYLTVAQYESDIWVADLRR